MSKFQQHSEIKNQFPNLELTERNLSQYSMNKNPKSIIRLNYYVVDSEIHEIFFESKIYESSNFLNEFGQLNKISSIDKERIAKITNFKGN